MSLMLAASMPIFRHFWHHFWTKYPLMANSLGRSSHRNSPRFVELVPYLAWHKPRRLLSGFAEYIHTWCCLRWAKPRIYPWDQLHPLIFVCQIMPNRIERYLTEPLGASERCASAWTNKTREATGNLSEMSEEFDAQCFTTRKNVSLTSIDCIFWMIFWIFWMIFWYSIPKRRDTLDISQMVQKLLVISYPLVTEHNYGESSFPLGKSTISMIIFNSYLSHNPLFLWPFSIAM